MMAPAPPAPEASDETLRAATPQDADAVVALLARAMPDGWSPEAVVADLARPDRRWHVVTASGDDRPIGVGALAVAPDGVAEILTVAVDPDHRRGGIGARLVGALLRDAAAAGARAVELEVRVGNVAAIHLYETAGFRDVRRRRGYYRDGEDARVLQRPLDRTEVR